MAITVMTEFIKENLKVTINTQAKVKKEIFKYTLTSKTNSADKNNEIIGKEILQFENGMSHFIIKNVKKNISYKLKIDKTIWTTELIKNINNSKFFIKFDFFR